MFSSAWIPALLALVAPTFAASRGLPPYITTCSRNDPKLNECIVRNGQKAIPQFINGDPKYRVPNLNPMTITEMRVVQGTRQIGMNITMTNVKVYGLKDTIFKAARMDIAKRYSEWDFENPRLEFDSQYTVNGRVLLLPISGNGRANVTLIGLKLTYKHGWDLVKKKGKEHVRITKSDLDFDMAKGYIYLENLFNGDKLLGDNMNQFLNENWSEVLKDVGPGMAEAFGNLFRNMLTNIAEQVPFDMVYPDTKV